MKQCVCVNFLNHPRIEVKTDSQIATHNDIDPKNLNELPKLLGNSASVVMMNAPERSWFVETRKLNPKAHVGLVTPLPMHEYHRVLDLEAAMRCDHIFHNNPALLPRMMRGVMQSLGSGFQSSSYLEGKIQFTECLVSKTSERHEANEKICKIASAEGGANGRYIRSICEELLTNALYDAPVAGGLVSSEEFGKEIDLGDRPVKIAFACDENYFLLSARDPFGSFSKQKFAEYGHKIVKHHHKEDLLDHKMGGAGLGLLRILFYSHAMIVNVTPGKSTEVVVLVPRKLQAQNFVAQPRSFSYFLS